MTRRARRILGAILLVLGASLLMLATETIGGLVLIGLAIVIEMIGLYLEQRK